MPDAPDFDKYLRNSKRHSVQDLGEVSVRLGSINTYDRRGEVLFLDDFRHGIEGWTVVKPSNGYFRLSTDRSFLSPYCAKFNAVTSGSFQAGAYRSTGANLDGKLGVETCFVKLQYPHWYEIQQTYITPTTIYRGRIRLDVSTQIASIYNSSGVYEPIDLDLSDFQTNDLIAFVKLVWDPTNGTYTRVMFNNQYLDLKDKSCRVIQSSGSSAGTYGFIMNANSAITMETYLLHVIVTANEP